MSRYISDLTAGTPVWIDENAIHCEWIYLGVDNSGNCRLLRVEAPLQKRMHSSNVATYPGSEADAWYEDETNGFLSRFDANTINALQATTICCADYATSGDGTVQYIETTRRAMPLSYKEVGFGGSETDVSFLPALLAYYNTSTANTARIAKNTAGSAVNWWLRSGYNAQQFRSVNAVGTAGNGLAAVTYSYQRPAISVAPATLVSDEGADSIFLLPDGRRTYWTIDALCKMGKSVSRPKKAKLIVPETNISSATYKVANNAGDASPAWVNCANGSVVDLPNTTKETTNYELAVKVDAQASTHDGCIGEPILIVETED